jgi:hypothetical protein
MPPLAVLVADAYQYPGWFPCFQNGHNLARLGPIEVWGYKVIPPSFGSIQYRNPPLLRAILHPVVVLTADISQDLSRYRVCVSVAAEEPHHPLWLLERLNQSVEEYAIETRIREIYAILGMLIEGVHGNPSNV